MSEIEFLREFKLMMLQGLVIKKYCTITLNNQEIYYKYVFRNFYIKPIEHKLCWNSNKKDNPFIKYNNIIKIIIVNEFHLTSLFLLSRGNEVDEYNPLRVINDYILPFSISKELLKRVLVIKIKNSKDLILEFINEYSCELFYDGMILLLKDYKKEIENKKKEEEKNNRKLILRRILTEESLKDSDEE
jgi:hypothetical protein